MSDSKALVPIGEKLRAYVLTERAQIGGMIRRIGEIVRVLPSEAGPHMTLHETEESDMNDVQFQDLKAMLEPIRELAQRQLDAMQTPQRALSTRQIMGTDATRADVAEAGAPVSVETEQGTMPAAHGLMGGPAVPDHEMAPAETSPAVTSDGRIKEAGENATEPGKFTES